MIDENFTFWGNLKRYFDIKKTKIPFLERQHWKCFENLR